MTPTPPESPDQGPEHNPAELTKDQVGEGWRLLTVAEVSSRSRASECDCYAWLPIAKAWSANYKGYDKSITYRRRVAPEQEQARNNALNKLAYEQSGEPRTECPTCAGMNDLVATQGQRIAELLPCPFCGKPVQIQFWNHSEQSGSVKVQCRAHGCCCPSSGWHNDAEAAVTQWNTRAPSAELTQAQADAAAMRDALHSAEICIQSLTLTLANTSRRNDSDSRDTEFATAGRVIDVMSAALSTTAGKDLLEQLRKAEAERDDARKERDDYKFRHELRKLTVDLYAEMTEKAGKAVGLNTEKADPPEWLDAIKRVVSERDAALEQLRKAEAERDEAVRHIQLAGGYHERTPREIEIAEVLSDSPPELWESADHALNDLLDIIDAGRNRVFTAEAERDAANALVEAIKQEADKLHSECIRDGETDAYCLTSEQIAALAEVAKALSPRTTENTKPQ